MQNWLQKISQFAEPTETAEPETEVNYPLAGPMVGGLRVSEDMNNMSSIGASFEQYEILDGIREVPMSHFTSAVPHDNFQARNDIIRCQDLAEEIRDSGEIMPLIVVIDDEPGPYILEGGHRFVALYLLGIQSFPALIVVDED